MAGWLSGTASSASRKGAYLTTTSSVSVRQVGVLALTCSTCGSVTFLIAGKSVGTLSLARTGAATRRLLLLPRFATTRTGVLRLVVATSGRLVRVDGLAVTAR